MGPIKEAKKNPFFAAEEFLERLGKKANSQKNYQILDEELKPFDTLIIESTRVGLTEIKRQKIKDWIESGGHLIVQATEIYDDELGTSRDLLLDQLGVRLYENTNFDWDVDREERVTEVVFADTESKTKIYFDSEYYIQDASGKATFIGGNDYSDLFAQYDYHEGMVTVITDMGIWKNPRISSYDHAMFLIQLVGGAEDVWFLYNRLQPSLLKVMIDLIPMIVVSFVLLIGVCLFSASWRKGRPQSDELRIQREIMQHIEAAGEFSYRNDDGKELLENAKNFLNSKLKRSIHRYNQLNDKEKIVKLSHLTSISQNDLSILWQDDDASPDEFANKIILIQKINKRL